MNCRTSLFLILLLSLFAKCKQVTRATDFITNPSAREVYLRALDKDSAGLNSFQNVYEAAMTDSISANLPYVETGHFWDTNPSANGYTVFLQQGEKFHARLELDSINTKGFFSLFQHTQDSINPLKLIVENLPGETEILYDIKETGDYKIVIQTELLANTPFQLLLYRTPRFGFPVSGKGNAAIQSFWGANRDGGRRSHEGLDIFADRGTPALAAVDGMVSSTGDRGLGGKQVWLRSGIFGNSIYYAHLDSIIASTGQRVKVGDTLGLVGNTGNARTTPPHLHFGIYKRGRGAINPLP
ncbi:MAG: M23 family metallopeptidase, partial [Leeuwenhoekiella sp.]